MFFARWLDVKFSVWCDMVIDDILNKRAQLTITKPAESAALKVPQSFPEALRLVLSWQSATRSWKPRTPLCTTSCTS